MALQTGDTKEVPVRTAIANIDENSSPTRESKQESSSEIRTAIRYRALWIRKLRALIHD